MTDDSLSYLQGHPETAETYRRYLVNRRIADQGQLRIAVCGIYNAGKSSLLNVLVGQFDEGSEAFKTGAARMTSLVSEKQVGDMVYVDTPGIDGAELDDEIAWSGILEADCFLYAHRLLAVEFEQQEIKFLQLLKKQVQGLENRLALVITQVDEVPDENDAAIRHVAILKAFTDAAGFEPRITFLVSSRRFAKGTAQGKMGLVTRSCIPELQAWIEQLGSPKSRARRQSFRQNRLETERAVLVGQLQSIADAMKSDCQRRARAHETRILAFEAAVAMLVVKVRGALQRIDAVS